MQLRELIKEIRQRKKWTQVQLAQELKTNQQNVQGMENAGTNLEKQFAIFVKLLPLCKDLGIDPAHCLKDVADTEKEVFGYVEKAIDRVETGEPHLRRTRKRKKKGTGFVSSRGITGR